MDKCRLRQLTGQFLAQKNIIGVGGQSVDDTMKIIIAAQACLLILHLGLRHYDGWSDIRLYPDAFVVAEQSVDAAGVVHESQRTLEGQAWQQGPVILSWSDILDDIHASTHLRGSNVVLHEFAHKLDFLNGAANGMPPLPADIEREQWTKDFSEAYSRVRERVSRHIRTVIDPYAAHSPGEFFAVVTEVFFEDSQRLQQRFPRVYAELERYYRQNPRMRHGSTG